MVSITQLKFGYGKKTVFNNISFEMEAGKIYGLLGENGVGKTTMLRIVAGLLFPDEGRCNVLATNPAKRQPSFLQDVYYLPEELPTPHLHIVDFAKRNGCFYQRFSQTQFESYLHEFSVDASSKFTELSFGQKKKAMIAFGLATNARLFLFDEPTNGLDIPSKAQFRKVIAGAATDENTFVLSTHQVRDLENLIDPIIILDHCDVLLNHSMEAIANVNARFLDIEQLFIEAMKDKAQFKQLFN